MTNFDQVREYVHSHDLSGEMEQGQWETDVVDDPMITTSLRLPKSLLDWVRDRAGSEHVTPSAWIRTLVEQQRDGHPDLEHRVSALEELLASVFVEPAQCAGGVGVAGHAAGQTFRRAPVPLVDAAHRVRVVQPTRVPAVAGHGRVTKAIKKETPAKSRKSRRSDEA